MPARDIPGAATSFKENAPLDPVGHLLHKPIPPRLEVIQIYLIHINKHKDTIKMGRQGKIHQMREQEKAPEKELIETEASDYQIYTLKQWL